MNDLYCFTFVWFSTVQNIISTWSNLLCYPFSLRNEILHPLSSKKRNNSSRSNLLISAIRYNELSWCSNKNFFIIEGKQNFRNKTIFTLRMVWSPWQNAEYRTSPYNAFYSILRSCNPVEAEYTDYVNQLKVDWPGNKPSSNKNYQSHPLLGLRNINACINYGSRNKLALSKNFCASLTVEMLCQF